MSLQQQGTSNNASPRENGSDSAEGTTPQQVDTLSTPPLSGDKDEKAWVELKGLDINTTGNESEKEEPDSDGETLKESMAVHFRGLVDDDEFEEALFAPPFPSNDDEQLDEEFRIPLIPEIASRNPDLLVEDNSNLSVAEMVRRCVQYLSLNVASKTPIKRTHIIKYAMDSQPKYFGKVMRKVDAIFKNTFGLKIVKIKLDGNNQPCVANDLDFGDNKIVGFIIVSSFPAMTFNKIAEQGFNCSVFVNM